MEKFLHKTSRSLLQLAQL